MFFLKTVLPELFWDEELLCDHQFLIFAVSRKLKYLHPIPEGLMNRLQDIGGGDEHHFGKVKSNIDIVIRK